LAFGELIDGDGRLFSSAAENGASLLFGFGVVNMSVGFVTKSEQPHLAGRMTCGHVMQRRDRAIVSDTQAAWDIKYLTLMAE
jgi:hypothetical protein